MKTVPIIPEHEKYEYRLTGKEFEYIAVIFKKHKQIMNNLHGYLNLDKIQDIAGRNLIPGCINFRDNIIALADEFNIGRNP